jgi:dihydrofolate reductase
MFNQITLDGYFSGKNGDFSWAHAASDDAEWKEFIEGNASGGGVLLFGRVTYQLMASYWPTPMAAANDPVVAAGMNAMPKVVFSRTLKEASWSNTRLVTRDLTGEVRRMKQASGADMAILGSGSIVAQLAEAGLIDHYQLVVNPVALGSGRTLFEGVTRPLNFRLASSRVFRNGRVLLEYAP